MKTQIALSVLGALALQACGPRGGSLYTSNFTSNRMQALCSKSLPPKLSPESSEKANDKCHAPSAPLGSFLVSDANDRLILTVPLQKDANSSTDEIARLAYQNATTQKLLEFKCTRLDATSLSCVPSCEMELKNASNNVPTPCAPVQNLKLTRNPADQGAWTFRLLTIRSACGATLTYQSDVKDDVGCAERTSSRRIDMAHFPTLDIATAP